MCVCVSSCQLSGLWQSHLSMWVLDQGNEAKKREVLSCLSEPFNSVVSVKAPRRMSSDSSAQALLCQFSISPRQCQNRHTQASWATSGEIPNHPRSNNKDQRLPSSPPGSCKCNELFGKDHDNLKLKWLVSAKSEPVLYLAELTTHRVGLAEWWKSNTSSLPHLANLALSSLGALPSNVLSERLFSYTEDVTSKNRCQLLPANAKWLVALQCNLPTLGFCISGYLQFFTRIFGILVHIMNLIFTENFW